MSDKTYDIILQALGAALFDTEKPELNIDDIAQVIAEAKAQAVFTCIYPVLQNDLKKLLSPEKFTQIENEFISCVANNMRVSFEHNELNEVMQKNNIRYVILKGCSSSAYYKEEELRTMGDVDFLVKEEDVVKAIRVLEQNGFEKDQYEFTTNQSAYKRPPNSIWEIHKSVTGIPNNDVGKLIEKMFSDIFETSSLYEKDGLKYFVPSSFHHGLILLLHKASHMTAGGLGLRQLCDWAVFVSVFNDSEFCDIFENKLNDIGLWKFAQIMTLLCEKYLYEPKKLWAADCGVKDDELEDILNDILSGGNFGQKDKNRYREIKYITDRKEGKVGNKNLLSQFFESLNYKVYADYSFISKYKIFLPIGWVLEAFSYLLLIIKGERKTNKSMSVIKDASKRKKIYSKFNLFEV